MLYVFGEYELDTQLYELRQAGTPLPVEPKVFDVLAYLVQHRDNVVSKSELLEHVWPDQYISEAALSGCVMAARKAVGDSGRVQQVIQTVHGRGYRFVASIEERAHEAPQVSPPVVPVALPEPQEQLVPGTPGSLPSPDARHCPACQHANRAAAVFCVVCGTRLVQTCHGCGQVVHLPAAFCPACGWRLEETPPASVGPAEVPRSRFVGREQELATLQALFAQVERGQGQAVALVGEPAIGKSWLLNEFRRRLPDGQATYLEGRCRSYGRTMPYLPLRDLVRQYCGILAADSAETMATKVSQRLQANGLTAAEGTALLLHLLGIQERVGQNAGLSPETRRVRTFVTLRQLFLTGSRQQPLIIVVEDLDWSDPTSEDWLAALLDSLANARILLLVTSHLAYRPAWLSTPVTTQISLAPLMPHDSLRLVQSVLPQERLSAPLVQAILARGAGHPFFLEELARAIAEQRASALDVVMPDTIRGVLMARLAQLPEGARRLLQTASVLDRTFPVRLLQAVWGGAEGMDAALLELERRALCYEQQGAQGPTYVLKHALLQDVVYKSLLPAHRQSLHMAAGQAMETLYAAHRTDADALLAYHYAQTDAATTAIAYLTRAAEQAARGWAHVEAAEILREALGHVDRLPAPEHDRCRLDLVLRQAHSLFALGRFQDSATLLRQQQTRLTQLQDAQLTGRYALLLSHTAQHLGEWESAVQYAHHAIEAATAGHDTDTRGQALHVLAMACYWAGQPLEGVAYSQQAITLLAQGAERSRLGMAYFVLGLHCLLLGDCEGALQAAAQADTLGQESGDTHLQTCAAWTTGWAQATRGAWAAGVVACQRGLALAPDPLSTAFALGSLGYAYLEQGDAREALPCLEQASEYMHQLQYQRFESLYTTWLGAVYGRHGDVNRARDLAHQGLMLAETAQYRFGVGWAQRTLGTLAQASGALAEAEQHLHQALDTFTAMPARGDMARTHLALAELAQHQGNREVARQHLREAHHLFTTLRLSTHAERTAHRAQALGLSLATDTATSPNQNPAAATRMHTTPRKGARPRRSDPMQSSL